MRERLVELLLKDLCVDYGFCLPVDAQERLVHEPPDDVDAFVDAVYVAEGLDPALADARVRRAMRDRVEDSFRRAAHAAHQYSSDHRREIEASERCGCFYCGGMFAPAEIQEWTDSGKTALCPRCGIDSVIGSQSVWPITPGFLERVHEQWFNA